MHSHSFGCAQMTRVLSQALMRTPRRTLKHNHTHQAVVEKTPLEIQRALKIVSRLRRRKQQRYACKAYLQQGYYLQGTSLTVRS